MLLSYKGIVFDDWTEGEFGEIWAEMCADCAAKYGDTIAGEIDDGGTACGCCSVKGCHNTGDNPHKMHYYIDFDRALVKIEDARG